MPHPVIVEEVSTVTAKGQTTVPRAVRRALGVGPGDRIAFRVEGGQVTLRAAADEAAEDPALAPFLALLATDLAARPAEAVRPLPEALVARMQALAEAAGDADPDAPITGATAL